MGGLRMGVVGGPPRTLTPRSERTVKRAARHIARIKSGGGATSRRKGAGAEREFRDLLRAFGFRASRGQPPYGDVVHDVPNTHWEVKRRETLAIPAWTRQAEQDARPGEVPVVAYRRSREPWRVVVPAEHYLRLRRDEVDAELAWAAGLFEGEGCFYLQQQEGRRSFFGMKLSMTDRATVERFRETLGCGKVYGPYAQRGWGDKEIYDWRLYGPEARVFLAEHAGFVDLLSDRRRARLTEILTTLQAEEASSDAVST